MKKQLVILLIISISLAKYSYAQTLDPTLNKINSLDFDYYEDKPVDSFLHALPSGYLEMKLIGHVKNNHVRCLSIVYPNHVTVVVNVSKFQYMNPVDPNRIWDLTLYKREKIGYAFFINPN